METDSFLWHNLFLMTTTTTSTSARFNGLHDILSIDYLRDPGHVIGNSRVDARVLAVGATIANRHQAELVPAVGLRAHLVLRLQVVVVVGWLLLLLL